MYGTEDGAGEEWKLLRGVCDALDQVGFRMRDGGLGLTVESTPEGVRVGWRQSHTPLRLTTGRAPGRAPVGSSASDRGYGQGINAAIVAAVVAMLEQAGYRVRAERFSLLVTPDAQA